MTARYSAFLLKTVRSLGIRAGIDCDRNWWGNSNPPMEGLLIIGTGAIDDDREPPGYLYAFSLDPNAGRRVEWRVPLDGEASGNAAAIDNTTNTAYVGTTAGTLYAIDISAGDVSTSVSNGHLPQKAPFPVR